MKIDPVTFEVDTTGGTHPIYVWEAPVRIWHWVMAVCMAVMIVTGYLIGAPLVANLGDTWMTYDLGYIRLAHFVAGMIFAVLFLYRIFWAIVGNRYARMIFIPPLWSMKWWKGVFAQVLYYLFLRKTAPDIRQRSTLENDIVRRRRKRKEQSDSERVKHHERESEARWRARVGARMERIEQKSLILAQDERWRRA